MMVKVYCKNCKYLDKGGTAYGFYNDSQCMHTNNIIKEYTLGNIGVNILEHWYNINYLKDCKNYKRKWWKFWAGVATI